MQNYKKMTTCTSPEYVWQNINKLQYGSIDPLDIH